MNFIQVGNRLINLDNVTDIDLDWRLIEDGPGVVLITFISPGGETGRGMMLKGDDAEAFRELVQRKVRYENRA